MEEVRCKNCNKLLAKANIFHGAIKCHGCYMVFEYLVTSNLQEISNADIIPIETNESNATSVVE